MPNFKLLICYFKNNGPSRSEYALLALMFLGGHRMLADAMLSWFGVHAPSADAVWIPYDLLAIAVLVALTPVPRNKAPAGSTQSAEPVLISQPDSSEQKKAA